jgi:biotin carboxylase
MYKNNVIVIAGGPWQLPLVRFLKQKNNKVYVVNPKTTVTTEAADGHIQIDVNNTDAIDSAIRGLSPTCITSDQSDISTMTVALLCQRYKLQGNTPETIRKFTDKFAMYEFGKSIGVPVPESAIVENEQGVLEFMAAHPGPVITKPLSATNSRGFRTIPRPEDVSLACESLRFSKGQIIVQEYVAGENQITLDGVCSGGKHKTLAVSTKGAYFKPGLTSSVRYPSKLPNLEEIIKINDRYVEEAGLQFGLTHGEYIVGEKFKMIEIAARGAGAGITDKIIPWVSGIHPYDILYQSLMGNPVDVKNLTPTAKPGILQFYDEYEMQECDHNKAREVSKLPGVASFLFDFRKDQFAIDPYNTRHTMGIYLTETEEELDALIKQIDDMICK